MRRTALLGAGLTGILLLTGCGSSDDGEAELSVAGAYMPQPVSDTMAAGFLTVTNKGGTKAELTSVTSDLGEVTMHETVDSAMRQADRLDVPAHGQLVFKSGGTHLMFEKLKHQPKQGQTVSVELHFADSDPVTVEMPVKSATYTPKTGH
ncbi:copper chaperone PCu(A)C [Streptomyces sp. NBC_00028]|uniref:copper chaperone PCu(A)C n=1 Tax=Streptomyces sp. NBC_00028 TaxID=2975624 RepID=UPI003249662A